MEFDAKQATVALKVTPKEEKLLLELRKPIAERVAALKAKAEAYRTYVAALQNINKGKS